MNHSTTERREGVLRGSCFFHSRYSAMSKYFFPVLIQILRVLFRQLHTGRLLPRHVTVGFSD